MNRLMEDLTERMGQAERQMAAELGEFTLFGLFEDTENPGRWDLIAAAPWTDAQRRADVIQTIAMSIVSKLDPRSAVGIGRIVPLESDSEFVEAVTRRFPTQDEVREVEGGTYGGVDVPHAYILTARWVPATAAAA